MEMIVFLGTTNLCMSCASRISNQIIWLMITYAEIKLAIPDSEKFLWLRSVQKHFCELRCVAHMICASKKKLIQVHFDQRIIANSIKNKELKQLYPRLLLSIFVWVSLTDYIEWIVLELFFSWMFLIVTVILFMPTQLFRMND